MVLFHTGAQLLEPCDHTPPDVCGWPNRNKSPLLEPVFLAVDWEIWEPWNQTGLSSNPDSAALIDFGGAVGGLPIAVQPT